MLYKVGMANVKRQYLLELMFDWSGSLKK